MPRRRAPILPWVRGLAGILWLCALVAGVKALDLTALQRPAEPLAPPTEVREDWQRWVSSISSSTETVLPAASSEVGDNPGHFVRVDVTGYSSRPEETDDDPFITAMCTVTAPGVIALSRDLLRTFTPGAPFDFGDKVLLPGVGIYRVEDTMNRRWKLRADIWFAKTEDAYQWGRRVTYLSRVEEDTPILAYEIPSQSSSNRSFPAQPAL